MADYPLRRRSRTAVFPDSAAPCLRTRDSTARISAPLVGCALHGFRNGHQAIRKRSRNCLSTYTAPSSFCPKFYHFKL